LPVGTKEIHEDLRAGNPTSEPRLGLGASRIRRRKSYLAVTFSSIATAILQKRSEQYVPVSSLWDILFQLNYSNATAKAIGSSQTNEQTHFQKIAETIISPFMNYWNALYKTKGNPTHDRVKLEVLLDQGNAKHTNLQRNA
jgi:hypothetical protein